MAALLSRSWAGEDDFINAAVAKGSLPLLQRLVIALLSVIESGQDRACWAKRILSERVEPESQRLFHAALD